MLLTMLSTEDRNVDIRAGIADMLSCHTDAILSFREAIISGVRNPPFSDENRAMRSLPSSMGSMVSAICDTVLRALLIWERSVATPQTQKIAMNIRSMTYTTIAALLRIRDLGLLPLYDLATGSARAILVLDRRNPIRKD